MTGHQRVLSTQLIYGGRNITVWPSEMIFAMHTAVESRGSEIRVSATPPAGSFSARRGCRVRLVWGHLSAFLFLTGTFQPKYMLTLLIPFLSYFVPFSSGFEFIPKSQVCVEFIAKR